MKRRRRLRKEIVITLRVMLAVLIATIIYLLLNFNINFVGAKSIHEDASSYKTRDALVFYPSTKVGKKTAKEVANNATKNSIIDYALVPYGDYYKVSYPDDSCFYIDQSGNDLKIESISDEAKPIVSDYLRYQMKKAEIDEAYTLKFLEETYYENIDLSKVGMNIDGENLSIYFNKYDFDCKIPLIYMQDYIGCNLGYSNEEYIKPRYVSSGRKKICFTFDDGPYIPTSSQIVDELYKYDSSATFFILGIRLNEDNINFCNESIKKGMEYGSHTQNHKSFSKLTLSKALEEIYIPYNDLYNNIGYEMKTYRPPYGTRSKDVEENINLTAILWNVDSLDWDYRSKYEHDTCVEVVTNGVIEKADENDVVLFHDIYQTSADTISELIKYYINEGYQIVSVSELMDCLGISGVTSFSGK